MRPLFLALALGAFVAVAQAQSPETSPPPQAPQPSAAPVPGPPEPEPEPEPEAAPAPAEPTTPAPPPLSRAVDSERAPERPLRPPPPSGPFVRFALGAGVALLTDGDASDLRLPSYAHLDLGYAFSPELAVTARFGTWLSFEPWALDFIGAGVSFGFVTPETMFVTVLVGASLRDDSFGPSGDEDVQGLAVQVDIGQRWTLVSVLYFELGAHFELGTPWLADEADFVSFGVGPFVSIRWGG